LHRESARRVASFGAIGVASTLAYVLLYAAFRDVAPAGVANALALVIPAVANTAANRRLTFAVQGRDGLARDHAAGLVALAAALAITSISLAALAAIAPRHGRMTEIAVLVAANAAATLIRFLLLRRALTRRVPLASRSVSRRIPALAPALLAHAPSGALAPMLVAALACARRPGDLRRFIGGSGLAIDRARDVRTSSASPLATLSQSERTRG
jgi:putative flippase GtrA